MTLQNHNHRALPSWTSERPNNANTAFLVQEIVMDRFRQKLEIIRARYKNAIIVRTTAAQERMQYIRSTTTSPIVSRRYSKRFQWAKSEPTLLARNNGSRETRNNNAGEAEFAGSTGVSYKSGRWIHRNNGSQVQGTATGEEGAQIADSARKFTGQETDVQRNPNGNGICRNGSNGLTRRIPVTVNFEGRSKTNGYVTRETNKALQLVQEKGPGPETETVPSRRKIFLLSLSLTLQFLELILFVIFVIVNSHQKHYKIAVSAVTAFSLLTFIPSRLARTFEVRLGALVQEEFSHGKAKLISRLIKVHVFTPIIWTLLVRQVARKCILHQNDGRKRFQIVQSIFKEYNLACGTSLIFHSCLQIGIALYLLFLANGGSSRFLINLRTSMGIEYSYQAMTLAVIAVNVLTIAKYVGVKLLDRRGNKRTCHN